MEEVEPEDAVAEVPVEEAALLIFFHHTVTCTTHVWWMCGDCVVQVWCEHSHTSSCCRLEEAAERPAQPLRQITITMCGKDGITMVITRFLIT